MKTLTISLKAFTEMLHGLIVSGVTFEADEKDGIVTVTFTGGY